MPVPRYLSDAFPAAELEKAAARGASAAASCRIEVLGDGKWRITYELPGWSYSAVVATDPQRGESDTSPTKVQDYEELMQDIERRKP